MPTIPTPAAFPGEAKGKDPLTVNVDVRLVGLDPVKAALRCGVDLLAAVSVYNVPEPVRVQASRFRESIRAWIADGNPDAETGEPPIGWGRYRVKQPVVDAIQWTGSNQAEIFERVGDDGFVPLDEPCGDDPDATASIRHPVHGDWRLVHTGDWIVRQADGSVYYEDDETFRSAYEVTNG